MTPDEFGWTLYAEELRKRGYGWAADAAIATAAELRKRREAGTFGPAAPGRGMACVCRPGPCVCAPAPAPVCPQCERPAPLKPPGAEGLLTRAQRAEELLVATERERDEARAELLSMTESRDAIRAERDEQRARAERAEAKRWSR